MGMVQVHVFPTNLCGVCVGGGGGGGVGGMVTTPCFSDILTLEGDNEYNSMFLRHIFEKGAGVVQYHFFRHTYEEAAEVWAQLHVFRHSYMEWWERGGGFNSLFFSHT